MEPSGAQTFQDWATGAAAIATAVAIVIGGGWALWRYVLPRPFTPNLEAEVLGCSVRGEARKYIYSAPLAVRNSSNVVFFVNKTFIQIHFVRPPYHKEPLALIVETLLPLGRDVNDTWPPGAYRTIVGHAEADSLCHVVYVEWNLQVQRPHWLGLFGRQHGVLTGLETVPVDADSLSLYMKEENDD